jgi:hypothetical protein
MRAAIFIAIIMFVASASGQNRFRINDASKTVDVVLQIGQCENEDGTGTCGPLTVRFFRKRSTVPFQTVRLKETSKWDPVPKANVTRRCDDQSIINFGDFNFDGVDDVAICDGPYGGYGGPSYRMYIYSKTAKRFVFSRAFTDMNDGGLGMFETDKKKKMHLVYSKSGCCWHQTLGYDVFRGRPRKVYEFTEDAMSTGDDDLMTITTKTLVNGRWRTRVKRAKTSEYYKQ